MEGPSKPDLQFKNNDDGTVTVSYKPTATGTYKLHIKFTHYHLPGMYLKLYFFLSFFANCQVFQSLKLVKLFQGAHSLSHANNLEQFGNLVKKTY